MTNITINIGSKLLVTLRTEKPDVLSGVLEENWNAVGKRYTKNVADNGDILYTWTA